MNNENVLNDVAASILKRAVELDNSKRYTESIVCYGEGIQVLINLAKSNPDAQYKKQLHDKIEQYISRAEKLKSYVEQEKSTGSYHEQIFVENNSTGNGYHTVFNRFLDNNVKWAVVEDPYIRTFYQCQNFLRFCELIVKSCKSLENVLLITTKSTEEQYNWLNVIRQDLIDRYKIDLVIEFSITLHDREIRLSNGWIIKIGRGLDYFKPVNKFSLGSFDMDLKLCSETTIDVFYSEHVRQRNESK